MARNSQEFQGKKIHVKGTKFSTNPLPTKTTIWTSMNILKTNKVRQETREPVLSILRDMHWGREEGKNCSCHLSCNFQSLTVKINTCYVLEGEEIKSIPSTKLDPGPIMVKTTARKRPLCTWPVASSHRLSLWHWLSRLAAKAMLPALPPPALDSTACRKDCSEGSERGGRWTHAQILQMKKIHNGLPKKG